MSNKVGSERRTALLAHLTETWGTLSLGVLALSESDAAESLHGGWTILQILEHMVVSENGMLRMVQAAQPVDQSLADATKESDLSSKVTSRSKPVPAPERVVPTGRFPTIAAAVVALGRARVATVAYVRETETNLDCVTVNHPFFGVISGHAMILVIAGHALRHLDQIAEIKRSEPGTGTRG